MAESIHQWPWEKKETKSICQLPTGITHEIRTEDAPLVRNLLPEIIIRDMFGIEYGQDWWFCHFTVQLENKAILKTAVKFDRLLIFFFYVGIVLGWGYFF